MENTESKVIIDSMSPSLPVALIVEEDANTTYAYLVELNGGAIGEVIIATWIRNHNPAPSGEGSLNFSADSAPMLPAEFCAHPQGAPRFKSEDLECLWSEDNTAAAISEKGELLCVINFSEEGEVTSFSKDCIKANELALPLENN